MTRVSATKAISRRIWPRTVGPYLMMPITFPIWLALLVLSRGEVEPFLDRVIEQDESERC